MIPVATQSKDVGQQPLACWDCGFESRERNGCLSLLSVVRCQVEVSAPSLSLVQRSPTLCGVSECDGEASITRMPLPTRGCRAMKKVLKLHQVGCSKFRNLSVFSDLLYVGCVETYRRISG
jgi:hypothetical protein